MGCSSSKHALDVAERVRAPSAPFATTDPNPNATQRDNDNSADSSDHADDSEWVTERTLDATAAYLARVGALYQTEDAEEYGAEEHGCEEDGGEEALADFGVDAASEGGEARTLDTSFRSTEHSPVDSANFMTLETQVAPPPFVQTCKYANGTYVGELEDGKPHGRGVHRDVDGNVYDGEWKAGKKHWGKVTFASGDVYDGEWKNGLRHGKGVYKWANGDVYDGDWLHGEKHGRGKMAFASGSIYNGEWAGRKFHGKGVYKWKTGHVYEGQYANGKRHGQGTMKNADGVVLEEGSWRECQRHGEFTWKGAAGPSRRVYHKGNLLSDERLGVWTASLYLNDEHTTCQICFEEFSSDLDTVDESSKRQLPVLSTCNHFYCHRCVLNAQAARVRENDGGVPARIPCMTCREEAAFCPSEPKYHTLLISLLERKEFSPDPLRWW